MIDFSAEIDPSGSIWLYSSSVRTNLLNFACTDPHLSTNELISVLVELIQTAAVENEVRFPNTIGLRICFMCFVHVYTLSSAIWFRLYRSLQLLIHLPELFATLHFIHYVFTTLACRPTGRFLFFLSECWCYLDRIRALPLPALQSSDSRIRPTSPLSAMRSLVRRFAPACYDSLAIGRQDRLAHRCKLPITLLLQCPRVEWMCLHLKSTQSPLFIY